MTLPFLHIDAFAKEPFEGNAAAIVFADPDSPLRDSWMQAVAAEMNLSETAFVTARDDGAWSLRWFTPSVEVDLCGHATLAAAYALWTENRASRATPLRFHTRSGVLTARWTSDERIELDFPSLTATEDNTAPETLLALGISKVVYSASNPNAYRLLVLDAEAEVRELSPDFTQLRTRSESYCVTAPSAHPQFDFVSRYFAPAHGIDEDPVTGSAHCMLAPYWSRRLAKPVVIGRQLSTRTGIVECEPRADRVLLRGDAVVVTRGELRA